MALCSSAFNNKSIKRSCSSTGNDNPKRTCLKNYRFPVFSKAVSTAAPANESSSDEDDNSDDENLCYKLHQIRAKRRASSRISFSLNPNLELSKYISKYSDDDEENDHDDHDSKHKPLLHNTNGVRTNSFSSASGRSNVAVDVDDTQLGNGNARASVIGAADFNLSEDCKPINLCQDLDLELLHLTQKKPSRSNSVDDFKIIQVPKSDYLARVRCFDYLVGSIDEAWARYCDAASCIEDEVYYSDENAKQASVDNHQLQQSEPSSNNNANVDDSDYELQSRHPHDEDEADDVIDNYSVNSTDLTDISDNYVNVKCRSQNNGSYHHKPSYMSLSYSSSSCSNSVSKQSSGKSNKYQKLKDRLTKAKYYLQDLIDSDDYQDIQNFWNRWDMIKYVTIELVEEDDDNDEVLESTIEELESGRYFVN